ncbi:MAG: hypothetical protein ACE5F1_15470 [Planctomycetota bacterium]
MNRPAFLTLSLALGALPVHAQQADYRLQPAARIGTSLQGLLLGRSGQPYLILLDRSGGPVRVADQTLYLGFTPSLMLLGAGRLNSLGALAFMIPTPANPVLAGIPIYSQAVVLEVPSKPFEASKGRSAILYKSPLAVVEDFENTSGFTGTFDRSIKGRLRGAAVARRTHRTINPLIGNPSPFPQPVSGPTNKFGTRYQMVLRARDLGARGEEEVVTAIRWRPFGGKVFDDAFTRLHLTLAHSPVVPDFRVGRFSALPIRPNSGLDLVFANNYKPQDPSTVIHDGAYRIQKSQLRPDGYMPYPAPKKDFVYNGYDSLLLDFRTAPTSTAAGTNGQMLYLMVLSSPRPYSCAYDSGTPSATVDPFKSLKARMGASIMFDYQLEFTRVKSRALSPFRKAPKPSPSYGTPSTAVTAPPRTSILVEYRGSSSPNASGATMWGTTASVANGKPYIQYRITLTADHRTGAVPSIDTLLIPVN